MARKGFSLIETLFAIVVMALIITPVPTLLTAINDSAKEIQTKDILFSTILEAMNSSVYNWDHHSKGNQKTGNRILDTNSTNFKRGSDVEAELENYLVRNIFFNRTYYKDELDVPIPSRKFFKLTEVDNNQTRTFATLPKDFHEADEISRNDFNDLDDWNGTKIYFNSVDNKIVDYTIKYNIFYIEDNSTGFKDTNSSKVNITINRTKLPDTQTSNLKLIEITGEENSSDPNPVKFALRYISINLGEPIVFFKDIEDTTLCTNQDEPCFCYLEVIDENITQAKCP